MPDQDSIRLRIRSHHEHVRTNVLKPGLKVESHRPGVPFPYPKPQCPIAAAVSLDFYSPHEHLRYAAAVPGPANVKPPELGR